MSGGWLGVRQLASELGGGLSSWLGCGLGSGLQRRGALEMDGRRRRRRCGGRHVGWGRRCRRCCRWSAPARGSAGSRMSGGSGRGGSGARALGLIGLIWRQSRLRSGAARAAAITAAMNGVPTLMLLMLLPSVSYGGAPYAIRALVHDVLAPIGRDTPVGLPTRRQRLRRLGLRLLRRRDGGGLGLDARYEYE